MSPCKKIAAALTVLLLSACGQPISPTSDKRIDAAVASGDPSALKAEDAAGLLTLATTKATELRQHQAQILRDIYNVDGTAPNLTLNVGSSSSSPLTPRGPTDATSYIVSDDGTGIAAVSELGSGRALAYGADVLGWMAGTSREQQHLPLFTRVFTWVVTGKAGGILPATIKFAHSDYDAGVIKSFITRIGKQSQEISCDIASTTNTCWHDADVFIFGPNTPNNSGLVDLVQSYLKAGKGVIYMHGGWWYGTGSQQVTEALGMNVGGEPGNYWASAPTYSVSANRTASDNLTQADVLAKLVTTLQLLGQDKYSKDFTADPTPIDGINLMVNSISGYETAGKNIFATNNTDLQRLLVLLADAWRPQVTYGQIDRTSDAAGFLRAYASDSWLAFNRSTTKTNTNGQGDYMPATAQQLATSTNFETIQLTLPQSGGITAIGRGAVPAKGVVVEIASAPAGISLGIQTSYVRTVGNPLTDSNYPRPRRPNSWNLPLQNNVDNNFVAPSGGPLFLNYSGATAGQTVTLKIKGTVKYAHFDFSNGTPPQADLDVAMAALQSKSYGWSTAKFRSGEVQQTIASASNSFGSFTPKQYVVDRFQRIVMDTNHIVSGYNDMPLSPAATSLCSSLSWDCMGGVHNPPGAQHFVSWMAACGDGCSGQPIDNNSWGLSPTWGWAHELGHNNVQRWMSILACSTECNNNTHSITAMLRGYALNGDDYNGSDNTYHSKLYKDIQDSRATGKTGEALRADMQARLWTGDIGYADAQGPMLAVYMQLAFLYTKVRYGQALPTVDPALEFMTLLSKGARLIGSQWTTATAANYGMGRYSNNGISNEDLMYVLGSKIIGQDLRNIFSMYGIPLSATATNSISDLGLPLAQLQFYALAYGKSNQLQTGQWLTLQSSTPAYPF